MFKNEKDNKRLNLLEELTLEDNEREIKWQKGKYVVYEANDETFKIIDNYTKINTNKTNNEATVKIDDEGTYKLTCELWKNLTNFVELFGEDQLTPDMFKKLDSKKHKKKIYLEVSAQIQIIIKEYLTLGYNYANTEDRYMNSMNKKQRRAYERLTKKALEKAKVKQQDNTEEIGDKEE